MPGPNTPKLKRGGRESKRVAAGTSAAPGTQPCGRKMLSPLSLAALLLGAPMGECAKSCPQSHRKYHKAEDAQADYCKVKLP